MPTSFVFKTGKVGSSVKELVDDVRLLMGKENQSFFCFCFLFF